MVRSLPHVELLSTVKIRIEIHRCDHGEIVVMTVYTLNTFDFREFGATKTDFILSMIERLG